LWLWIGPTCAEVWVVTDQDHSVEGTPDRLIELDAPVRIEAAFSAGLPTNPENAAATVRQRMAANKKALHLRLSRAYQDVIDAWQLGVDRIPAVVVDQRYVVYGERNLRRALSRIETYRRQQP
jgi:integrating conjugative element protein (TIGR03757 family)|tara:strand:- start:52 stop:420 length:369 start_codon:yes stop_codon:yes gene_type:complete